MESIIVNLEKLEGLQTIHEAEPKMWLIILEPRALWPAGLGIQGLVGLSQISLVFATAILHPRKFSKERRLT